MKSRNWAWRSNSTSRSPRFTRVPTCAIFVIVSVPTDCPARRGARIARDSTASVVPLRRKVRLESAWKLEDCPPLPLDCFFPALRPTSPSVPTMSARTTNAIPAATRPPRTGPRNHDPPGSRSSGGLSISGGEAGSIVVSAGDDDMLDCSADRFYGLAEIRPDYEDAIIQQKSCLEIQIPREYSFIRTRHLDRG